MGPHRAATHARRLVALHSESQIESKVTGFGDSTGKDTDRRLGDLYRVLYQIKERSILVIDVTAHDYRRKS